MPLRSIPFILGGLLLGFGIGLALEQPAGGLLAGGGLGVLLGAGGGLLKRSTE